MKKIIKEHKSEIKRLLILEALTNIGNKKTINITDIRYQLMNIFSERNIRFENENWFLYEFADRVKNLLLTLSSYDLISIKTKGIFSFFTLTDKGMNRYNKEKLTNLIEQSL